MSRSGCTQGRGLLGGMSSDLDTVPMETGRGEQRVPGEVLTQSTTRWERSVGKGLNERHLTRFLYLKLQTDGEL